MMLTLIIVLLAVHCSEVVAVQVQAKSRILISSSLKNVEIAKTDMYFLHEMRQLSEHGRFYNQTEHDFEVLKASCTCPGIPLVSCKKDECCYCKLQCPLPENSFSGEVMLPKETKCWHKQNYSTLLQRQILQGKEPKHRPWFAFLCDRIEDIHDYRSRLRTLFCVHGVNLGAPLFFFPINPGWTTMDDGDRLPSKLKTDYNWQNILLDIRIMDGIKEGNISHQRIGPYEFLVGVDSISTETISVPFSSSNSSSSRPQFHTGKINFTRDDSNLNTTEFVLFNVSTSSSNFFIKVSPHCSKYQEDKSLEDCSFLVNSQEKNCTNLYKIMHHATKVISYLLTNASNSSSWYQSPKSGQLRSSSHNNESDDHRIEEKQECNLIPKIIKIVNVWHKGQLKNVFYRFTDRQYLRNLQQNNDEYSIHFSLNNHHISEKNIANLPRFWENLFYSNCPDQFCWKDVLKIENPNASRINTLDENIWKMIVYVLLSFVSLIAYFWAEKTL